MTAKWARRSAGLALTAALLMTSAFTSAASATGSDDPSTSESSGDPLGPKNKASGTPAKIGMIADGVSEGISNEIDIQAAEATVKWLNEHMGGLGGHPIDLIVCTTDADPGKAADCANQLISDGVAGVFVSNSTQAESLWSVLHEAKIPVMFYGITEEDLLNDKRTFALTNPNGLLGDLPAGIAKENGAKTVTAVVIGVPAAVDAVEAARSRIEAQGRKLEIVEVPPGTADMTPQMQQVVSDNPKGVVNIVGNDSFCAAALNGLRTAGFKGEVVAIQECITDVTRNAVPGDFLEGVTVGATTPFADKSNPSVVQYLAVLDEYGESGADPEANNGLVAFIVASSFAIAANGVEGAVNPASVTKAIKSMPDSVMPGTGGQHFRCNGKADPTGRAICAANEVLYTTLDDEGNITTFKTLGEEDPAAS